MKVTSYSRPRPACARGSLARGRERAQAGLEQKRGFLTEAGCGDESDSLVRRLAGGVEGLHQVVGEGERNDSQVGRLDQQDGRPQPDEGQETSEGLQDVGVAGSGLADGGAQLGVGQGAEHREEAPESPDEQGQSVRTAVHEHALGRDKDPRANHVADDEADAVDERDFSPHLHFHAWITLGGL